MKVTIEGVEYERVISLYGECSRCVARPIDENNEITDLCSKINREILCKNHDAWQLAEPVNPKTKEEEEK